MRAVAITEYGGVPAVTELPKPEAASDKMIVRVEAAGMNPVDSAIASGAYKELMPATFPLVLGVDVAGVVEAVGGESAGFEEGDRVFGQLLTPPLGSTGTYAEFVSVPKDAPVAKVPQSIDSANVASSDSARVREYGAVETVDHRTDNVHDAVAALYPEGIDVLVDLANDAGEFADLASLVRSGGTALTTRYVADVDSLAARGVTGVNFAYQPTRPFLGGLADTVATGGIVPPPLATVALEDVPQVLRGNGNRARPAKTVIAVS